MTEATPEERHKVTVQRYVEEGYNEKELSVLRDTMTDDVVVHGLVGADGPVRGRDAYAEWASRLVTAFPDTRAEIDELVATGDRVAARWTVTATHRNEFAGVPATGESFEVTGLALFRMEDGRIAEKWYRQDDLGLLVQLGVVDAAATSPGTSPRRPANDSETARRTDRSDEP